MTDTQSLPKEMKNPIFFAVFHKNNTDTQYGHAAMWFDGQPLNVMADWDKKENNFSCSQLHIKDEKGIIGLREDRSVSVYVADASAFGIHTQADKDKLKEKMKKFHEDDKYHVVTDNCTSNIYDALGIKKTQGGLLSAFVVLPSDLEKELQSMQNDGKVVVVSKEFAKNYIDTQIAKESELTQLNKTDLKQTFQNISQNFAEQQKDNLNSMIVDLNQVEK